MFIQETFKLIKKNIFIFVFALQILLSFILYLNNINGEFVYDDHVIKQRKELRQINHSPKIFFEAYIPGEETLGTYRPLTTFSFSLNFILFGEETFSFHLINILINGICGFLVFVLIFKLFKSIPLAIFSSLLFSFLPIHTEAVSYIKSRDDILSAFFALLSWILFIYWREKKRMELLVSSSVSFFLAVLAKEFMVVLPILILTSDFILNNVRIKEVLRISLYFIPTFIAYFIFRILALSKHAFGTDDIHFIINPIGYVDLATRIMTAFKILYLYVFQTLIPINLSATYNYNQLTLVESPFSSWQMWGGIIIMIILIFLIIYRKTRASALGIGALTFLISYSIFSKFVFKAGEIFAEHWMYFPSVGIAMIIGYVFLKVYEKNKFVSILIFSLILMVFGVITISRNSVWATEESLYQSMIKTAPNSIRGFVAMSNLYLRDGNWVGASPYIKKGLEVSDQWPPLVEQYGVISLQNKDYLQSEWAGRKLIEILPQAPAGYKLLAVSLTNQGKYEESIDIVEGKLSGILMQRPELMEIMAINYYKLGDYAEARKYFGWTNKLSIEEKEAYLNKYNNP